jgi:hypothetical protein
VLNLQVSPDSDKTLGEHDLRIVNVFLQHASVIENAGLVKNLIGTWQAVKDSSLPHPSFFSVAIMQSRQVRVSVSTCLKFLYGQLIERARRLRREVSATFRSHSSRLVSPSPTRTPTGWHVNVGSGNYRFWNEIPDVVCSGCSSRRSGTTELRRRTIALQPGTGSVRDFGDSFSVTRARRAERSIDARSRRAFRLWPRTGTSAIRWSWLGAGHIPHPDLCFRRS